jgi:hypothetical protein
MHGFVLSVIAGLAVVFAGGFAQAQCGGICLYENMSPDMGRSGAGAGPAPRIRARPSGIRPA